MTLVASLMATVVASTPVAALPVDDGRSEVFAVNMNDNGVIAVHALNAATNYQTFLLQRLTPLPAPGADRANWVYKFADFDGDRVTDLIAVDRDDNGFTAVHVLDGSDDFQTYLLQTITPMGVTPSTWQIEAADYNADGRADLYLIDKNDTGHTTVHVLDGAGGYQLWSLHRFTPFGEATDPLWQFDVADYNNDRRADLYAIYKNDNGRTAVHVLDAASEFQTFTLHTLTPFGALLDPNWQLDVGDSNTDGRGDLYALYKNDGGRTAVHILDAASNFQIFTVHSVSVLLRTDDPIWDLEVGLQGTGATGPETYPDNARIKPPSESGDYTEYPEADASDCYGSTFLRKGSDGKLHLKWYIYCHQYPYLRIQLAPILIHPNGTKYFTDPKTWCQNNDHGINSCVYTATWPNPSGSQHWVMTWDSASNGAGVSVLGGIELPGDDPGGGAGTFSGGIRTCNTPGGISCLETRTNS